MFRNALSFRPCRAIDLVLLLPIFAVLTALFVFADLTPAKAQSADDFQRSFITPFPKGDRYKVLVVGDSLADGLWSGLYRAFADDTNLEIVQRSKVATGFTRPDYYDWNSQIDGILKEQPYQIAVVMFGASDDQSIRQGKEYLKPGTDGWRDAYGQRVETFIKKLRAAGLAVYWVGLPVMRSPDQSEDAETMNDIFREKAFINGAKYVDTWSGFTDEGGRYSAYGPDMQGQVRRLRADDGVQFTMRGYLKLAHFAEKEIRRDLNLAKLERDIPLAGSEEEQAKVMGRAVTTKMQPPGAPPAASFAQPDGAAKNPPAQPPAGAAPGAASQDGNQAAEPAKPQMSQSKVGDVSVVRPEISATALDAAQNMTPQAASGAPENETIASDIPGGLTALASISSLNDLSGSSKPKLPLTERPYYKVLIQGEQLKPKSGRADDFAWPKGS